MTGARVRGPSVTAAVVASTLLLLRGDEDLGHLVDRRALVALERAVREAVPLLGELLDRVPFTLLRLGAMGAERVVSPGFIAHYALRKRAVKDALVQAIADGYGQVVLVGAGFDMLSACVPPHARVFEVDLPATQEAKRRAVKEGEDGRVCYVAADLAVAGLREALRASPGFDPRGDTVYVAEGLLMYLRPERIASVLEAMRPEAPGRTRAIVSVVTPDRRGRVRLHTQREVVDLCMRWLDEPFAWGARRESLAALFAPHGMTVRDVVSPFDLRERHLPSRARRRLPRATGELVVIAEGAASLG